jgi:hypothetical protein
MAVPTRRVSSFVLSTLLVLGLAASPSVAQTACGPDGLTGPCCASASLSLPTLLKMTLGTAKRICFNQCAPSAALIGPLTISQPVPTGTWGVFTAQVTGPFVANVRLHYTRHWPHPTGGSVREVYRFVLLGDLVIPGAWTCPIEPAAVGPAFLYGYVDYVFAIGPQGCNQLRGAIVLGHACDQFIHNTSAGCTIPTLDPFGGHAGSASVVVAPGINFTPNASLQPPSGPSPTGPLVGMRTLTPPPGCRTNELISGSLTNGPQFCSCLPGIPSAQYTAQQLAVASSCGSTLQSFTLCPYDQAGAPWSFYTWSVGSWGPGPYPGPSYRLWLTEGYAIYIPSPPPACEPVREAVYYGAETMRALPPAAGGYRRVDLVDNYRPSNNGPLIGGLDPSAIQTRVVFLY